MNHPTTQYALDVVEGKIKTCKWEKLACQRHLNDLKRQGTEEFPFVFDETRADRVFKWFKFCRHVRGPFAGQPIELQQFQKFDKGCLFGWVHKDTGVRRFTDAFEERARGNVKSTEMSGVALYGMCSDCFYPPGETSKAVFESMPEVECAAVDKEQAGRVFGDAKAMAQASPDIAQRLDIPNKGLKIIHKTRKGWLRPLSKDSNNKDSGAPCIIIVDEYHKWKSSEIKDTLRSGFGKRKQSLIDIITTAGIDAENSPAKKERDTCCKILEGEFKAEHYFVMIRELDENDDPHDFDNLVKANPILQEDNEYSRGLLKEIKNEHDVAYGSNDPAKIREYLTKRCCLWQADSEDKFMSGHMDKFKSLAILKTEFFNLVRGRECFVGVDLSKTTDLTSCAFVFILDDNRYAIFTHGFMPKEKATQHEFSDRVPYKFWAENAWCTLTDGSVTDYAFVKNFILDLIAKENWKVREFCFDPYNATEMMQDFQNEYGENKVIEVRQGFTSLSAPTKKFRELVLQDRMIHDGNPLFIWCVSNAIELMQEGELIKIQKKNKDDTQRVDLLSATITAMFRAINNEGSSESIYSRRGFISF